MRGIIFPLLRQGAANAIKTKDLMEMTGIMDERAFRSQVARERREGLMILSKKSDGGGYFLPGTPQEARQYVAWMEREAKSIFRVSSAARKYGGEIEGQARIEEGLRCVEAEEVSPEGV